MDKCEDCKYFIRHYYLRNGVYCKISYGHCTKRRVKDIKNVKYCDVWEKAVVENPKEKRLSDAVNKMKWDLYELKKILGKTAGKICKREWENSELQRLPYA